MHLRASLLTLAGILVAALSTLTEEIAARPRGPIDPDPPVFQLVSRKPMDEGSAVAGVAHPVEPIYVVDEQGNAVRSVAGYVRLRTDHKSFYTAGTIGGKEGSPAVHTAPDFGLPITLWGDIEAIAALHRVIRGFAAAGGGCRIGVGDISSGFGGYPDFNGDLVSDHRTHQTGFNINLLLPCTGKPEVHVHVGREKNEDRFDLPATRKLINVMVAEGFRQFTTNVETNIMSDASGLPPLAGTWKSLGVVNAKSGSTAFRHEGGSVLYFIATKGGHGSHINSLYVGY